MHCHLDVVRVLADEKSCEAQISWGFVYGTCDENDDINGSIIQLVGHDGDWGELKLCTEGLS